MNKSSSLLLESVRRNRKKIILVTLRIRSTRVQQWNSVVKCVFCKSELQQRSTNQFWVCRFVHRAQTSSSLKQVLKSRSTRAMLSQFCGWPTMTIHRIPRCHPNNSTIVDFYKVELALISAQQNALQTCPFTFIHQQAALALKLVQSLI